MPLLTWPMASAPTSTIAKVGDFVIGLNSNGAWVGHKVTKVTSTRYYYSTTGYMTIASVVWVGTPTAGAALLTAIDKAVRATIDAAGGWA